VAAHELPEEIALLSDPRVDFEVINEPKPNNSQSAQRDKFAKRRANFRRIARFGDGYTALLDADDLVSHRLVEFLLRFKEQHGYVFWGGYLYDPGRRRIARFHGQRKFSDYCGSCAAVRFGPDDYRGGTRAYVERFFADAVWRHAAWEQTASRERRQLSPVLQPLVAYVIHDFQLPHQAPLARNKRTIGRPAPAFDRNWIANMMNQSAVDLSDELCEEFGLK
jgi:hypothetical protein